MTQPAKCPPKLEKKSYHVSSNDQALFAMPPSLCNAQTIPQFPQNHSATQLTSTSSLAARPTLLRTALLQIIQLPQTRPFALGRVVVEMKLAAPPEIQHLLDPRRPPVLLRKEQVLGERGRHFPASHHHLPQVGREAFVVARLERLHRRHARHGPLQQTASGVVEDEGEVPRQDPRFGVPVVAADVVGGEVAEVLDQHLVGEGEQAEVGRELVVFGRRLEGAAVEPVDEELEGRVVVFGQVELFGRGFGEVAAEGRAEVGGAVAEEVFVQAEGLALGADVDVYHLYRQKPVACQVRLGSKNISRKLHTSPGA